MFRLLKYLAVNPLLGGLIETFIIVKVQLLQFLVIVVACNVAFAYMGVLMFGDVLAAFLLSKVGEERIDERILSRCVHLRDVGLVKLLISKLVTRNEEQRQCALSVVEQLAITEDYQAHTILSTLSAANSASSFLTRGVLEYFRSSQQRNPRWKLPEELHVLLLRQIASEKHCIDLAYILKELGLAGALEQVKEEPKYGVAPSAEGEELPKGKEAMSHIGKLWKDLEKDEMKEWEAKKRAMPRTPMLPRP